MAHLGLICPELSGHLNPMTTLGRELQRRGHEVTVVARADGRAKARQAGLGFVLIGEREFPEGAMGKLSAQLGRLSGLKAMRFTVELLRRTAVTLLREAPDAIRAAKIDALLVDQVVPAGNTVAEALGIPLVTVCNALAINVDPILPPAVMPWRFARGFFSRARNRAGNAALHWLARPIIAEINTYRAEHRLGRWSTTAWVRVRPWPLSPSSRHFSTTRGRRCPNVFTTPDRGTIQLVVASQRIFLGRSWTAAR